MAPKPARKMTRLEIASAYPKRSTKKYVSESSSITTNELDATQYIYVNKDGSPLPFPDAPIPKLKSPINGVHEEKINAKRFTKEPKYGMIFKEEKGMESEVKTKVLVDLFAAPITLFPIVGGLSSLIFSWVAGSAILAFVGICGTIFGGAVFCHRLIFGLESITKDAYDKLQKQIIDQRNQDLDKLDKFLTEDTDPRPEDCLRELRSLHELLSKESGNVVCGKDILNNFEQMFQVCIKRIEKSDQLWRLSLKEKNTSKCKTILSEREKIVTELVSTTDHLAAVVRQTKDIGETKEDSELSELSRELEKTLTVARNTEKRISNLNGSDYDPKEFET